MALEDYLINIGHSANDKSGDPLRLAFQKVNGALTELFNTDNVTQYRVGDDTQFVRIELDGEGIPTGGITIQSGYDTSMPVYIKGGNASQDGVGGNVVIEAGAPPLATPEQLIQGSGPYAGTVGNIELSANQTTIESLGNMWTFGNDGILSLPVGGDIQIEGQTVLGSGSFNGVLNGIEDDTTPVIDFFGGSAGNHVVTLASDWTMKIKARADGNNEGHLYLQAGGSGTRVQVNGNGSTVQICASDGSQVSWWGFGKNGQLSLPTDGKIKDNNNYLTVENINIQGSIKDVTGGTGSTGQILSRASNGGVQWINNSGGGANTGDVQFSGGGIFTANDTTTTYSTSTTDGGSMELSLGNNQANLYAYNGVSGNIAQLILDNSTVYPTAHINVGNVEDQKTWAFNADGTLVTPNGLKLDQYQTISAGGQSIKIIPNYSGTSYVIIPPDGSGDALSISHTGSVVVTAGSNKQWSFGTDGSLTFPDTTVQTTAYTGNRAVSFWNTATPAQIISPTEDVIMCDTQAAGGTVGFIMPAPNSISVGKTITIKNIHGTNAIYVSGSAGGTVAIETEFGNVGTGAYTTISANNAFATFIWDGTAWRIINRHGI